MVLVVWPRQNVHEVGGTIRSGPTTSGSPDPEGESAPGLDGPEGEDRTSSQDELLDVLQIADCLSVHGLHGQPLMPTIRPEPMALDSLAFFLV